MKKRDRRRASSKRSSSVSKKEEKDRNFDTLKTGRSQPREKAADYGEYPHLWSR